MWHNICMANPECITVLLDEYINILEDIKNAITTGNDSAIMEFFGNAKQYRDSIK